MLTVPGLRAMSPPVISPDWEAPTTWPPTAPAGLGPGPSPSTPDIQVMFEGEVSTAIPVGGVQVAGELLLVMPPTKTSSSPGDVVAITGTEKLAPPPPTLPLGVATSTGSSVSTPL